jgi:hypothetical protein
MNHFIGVFCKLVFMHKSCRESESKFSLIFYKNII